MNERGHWSLELKEAWFVEKSDDHKLHSNSTAFEMYAQSFFRNHMEQK